MSSGEYMFFVLNSCTSTPLSLDHQCQMHLGSVNLNQVNTITPMAFCTAFLQFRFRI
jgi:hypothetical protein